MKFYRKGWTAKGEGGTIHFRMRHPDEEPKWEGASDLISTSRWTVSTPGWTEPPDDLDWKLDRKTKVGPYDPEGLSTEDRYARAAWRGEWQTKLAMANNCDHTTCSQGDGVWYVGSGSYEQWHPQTAFHRRCDAETYIAAAILKEGWSKYSDYDGIDSEPNWLDYS